MIWCRADTECIIPQIIWWVWHSPKADGIPIETCWIDGSRIKKKKKKMKVKGRKETRDLRSSGVRRNWQEPKSERSYWLNQRQLLTFEKTIRFFFYFKLKKKMKAHVKRSALDCWGMYSDHVCSIDRRVDQSDWTEWMMGGERCYCYATFVAMTTGTAPSLLSLSSSHYRWKSDSWQYTGHACPFFSTNAHGLLTICISVYCSTYHIFLPYYIADATYIYISFAVRG